MLECVFYLTKAWNLHNRRKVPWLPHIPRIHFCPTFNVFTLDQNIWKWILLMHVHLIYLRIKREHMNDLLMHDTIALTQAVYWTARPFWVYIRSCQNSSYVFYLYLSVHNLSLSLIGLIWLCWSHFANCIPLLI